MTPARRLPTGVSTGGAPGCPHCGTDNVAGAKFCMECGASLSTTCPACGHATIPGQKFCSECGTALAPGLTQAREATRTFASGASSVVVPMPRRDPTELRRVSVMFVDLVGYTALTESWDPSDVRDMLGHYFDAARGIVDRYGGTIDKFIGDAVMAVWGTPVAREDDAARSVRAALELVEAVASLGGRVGAPDLRARAGIVTGQAAHAEPRGGRGRWRPRQHGGPHSGRRRPRNGVRRRRHTPGDLGRRSPTRTRGATRSRASPSRFSCGAQSRC